MGESWIELEERMGSDHSDSLRLEVVIYVKSRQDLVLSLEKYVIVSLVRVVSLFDILLCWKVR